MSLTQPSEYYGTLYVVSSPSGGGKTTLVSQLLECTTDISRAITHTTRAPRPDEKDGVHYHFVSKEEFQTLVKDNGFLEYAEIFGNYYGTSVQEVRSKLKRGIDVVLVIDWQGAEQIRQKWKEAVTIFIMPPSIDILRARLLSRNQDSLETVELRMQDAVHQVSHYKKFDYLVMNDDFDVALANLRSIIMARRLLLAPQEKRYANLIKDLLSD